MNEIERRKKYTLDSIESLRGEVSISRDILSSNGCVFMTGSFGRLEASEGSDVDTFIACHQNGEERSLTNLSEIRVKANLIEAVERLKLPEFDGDGDYLRAFSDKELIESVGSQSDDYENTFTARLLLLLEAKPLVGRDFFNIIRRKIVEEYWNDYEGHETSFVPAYFCNDVLRLWRTFCVNYEARTSEDTPEKKSKRRSKNYKLRHTRIMTCYSALAMLAYGEQKKEKCSPEFAMQVCDLTPLERLDFLKSDGVKEAEKVLKLYEKSLIQTSASNFKEKFAVDAFNLERRIESRAFSEAVYELLLKSGQGTTLLKRILV